MISNETKTFGSGRSSSRFTESKHGKISTTIEFWTWANATPADVENSDRGAIGSSVYIIHGKPSAVNNGSFLCGGVWNESIKPC